MGAIGTDLCHSGASHSEEPGTHDRVSPSRWIADARPVVGSGFTASQCPGMTEGVP